MHNIFMEPPQLVGAPSFKNICHVHAPLSNDYLYTRFTWTREGIYIQS
jgi:hypothetical protein